MRRLLSSETELPKYLKRPPGHNQYYNVHMYLIIASYSKLSKQIECINSFEKNAWMPYQ